MDKPVSKQPKAPPVIETQNSTHWKLEKPENGASPSNKPKGKSKRPGKAEKSNTIT